MNHPTESFARPPMTFVGDGAPEVNVSDASIPQEHPVPMPGQPGSLSEGMSNFGRRGGDAYLESMIATASPARLRLMVIERAVEVSRHLAMLWRDHPGKRGTNEHSLKLLELLSELLSGVTDNSVDVCQSVADLYVFLCQHLIASEQNGDATMIDEIRLVLETEAETWRMVCAREGTPKAASRSRAAAVLSEPGGFNLEG